MSKKGQRDWRKNLTPRQRKAVEKLRFELAGMLGSSLVRLVLFGSRARGDYGRDSDIDIAVIVRGLTAELKHQILTRAAEIELDFLIPLSVLVMDEAQFLFLLSRERRLALDIEREGISICEDTPGVQ